MLVEGVVLDFDDRRGDGQLRSDEGECLYFHCVEIADGSRSIAVGARAQGQRAVGRQGRDELTNVRTLS